MNGLALSKGFYEEFGLPMLREQFPDLMPFLAVGLVGSGSERFGFDDEISRDHDFEPGFCVFLPSEETVDRKAEFRLERAYAKLPRDYEGFRRSGITPVGGSRHGVIRTSDFYREKVGSPNGDLTVEAWLTVPDYTLAEATNGEIFYDGYGEFTAIREKLSAMPADIRKKRLAGNLLLMAQSGQYNYTRCISHGEPEAAALAVREFVQAAMKVRFLLAGRYMPYYKWSFRALCGLEGNEKIAGLLSALLLDSASPEAVYDRIEDVAALTVADLITGGLTEAVCGDLEKHAYSVNDGIADGAIRNLHILAAV